MERPMVLIMVSGPANGLPSMETMVSPAFSPATAAGVVRPAQWSRPATLMLLVEWPKLRTRMMARTNAMRMCMAEPADATMIRWWKGC